MKWRVVFCAVWAAACTRSAPPVVAPAVPMPVPVTMPAVNDWQIARQAAIAMAEDGQHAAADSILQHFVRDHPGTASGAEADFWRAVLRADPAYRTLTPRERAALLDVYLASPSPSARHLEALVLRRLLDTVDSVRAAAEQARTTSDTRLKSRDDEIRRLTDEVERLHAELERIRKRLAPRKP